MGEPRNEPARNRIPKLARFPLAVLWLSLRSYGLVLLFTKSVHKPFSRASLSLSIATTCLTSSPVLRLPASGSLVPDNATSSVHHGDSPLLLPPKRCSSRDLLRALMPFVSGAAAPENS